jgi:hypothetical protein
MGQSQCMPFRWVSVPAVRASMRPEKSALPKRQGAFLGHSKSQDLLLFSVLDCKREIWSRKASVVTTKPNTSSERQERFQNIIVIDLIYY